MVYRPQYFELHELVCPDVFKKHGDMAWQFLDDKAVVVLDWIRRTLNKPIKVNDWKDGGSFTQRGLRCTICPLIKDAVKENRVYVTPHILGRAFDFDVEGMLASEVRVWLALNKDKLPYNIRLENNVSWVHMDTEDTGKKIHIFNP